MCRANDSNGSGNDDPNCLKIKAFRIRLSGLGPDCSEPDALTLLYRSQTEIFVDGSRIRPGSPAVSTLHRVVNVRTEEDEAVFWSRDPVRASGQVRFEVYLGEKRVLEGAFKREGEWRLECGTEEAVTAVVCVAVEGQAVPPSAVVKRRKKTKNNDRRRRRFDRLEVIPEEGEESDGVCWCDCEDGSESDGVELEEMCGCDCKMMERDLEGVRWAVDVGLWVMCLGVGFLVSKASARSLRRLRIL